MTDTITNPMTDTMKSALLGTLDAQRSHVSRCSTDSTTSASAPP